MVGHRVSRLPSNGACTRRTGSWCRRRGAPPRLRPGAPVVAVRRRHADDLHLAGPDWYEAHGIELVLGDPLLGLDTGARTATHRVGPGRGLGPVRARHRLLRLRAADPRRTTLPGAFAYRTIDDLDAIRDWAGGCRRGVVVGGGLLGLEAANALRLLGLEVTVVEFAPRLMAVQLDEGGGAALRRHVEQLGLAVRTGAAATEVVTGAGGALCAVSLRRGGRRSRPTSSCSPPASAPATSSPRPPGWTSASGAASWSTIAARPPCRPVRRRRGRLPRRPHLRARRPRPRHGGGGRRPHRRRRRHLHRRRPLDPAQAARGRGGLRRRPPRRRADEVVVADPTGGGGRRLLLDADGRLLGAVLVGDASPFGALVSAPCGRPGPSTIHWPCWPVPAAGRGCGRPARRGVPGLHVPQRHRRHHHEARHRRRRGRRRVKSCTEAGTGCGSCVPILQELVDAELALAGKRGGQAALPALRHDQGRAVRRRAGHRHPHLRRAGRRARHRPWLRDLPADGGLDVRVARRRVRARRRAGRAAGHQRPLPRQPPEATAPTRWSPRIPGGEITPEKLIVIGEVARDFDLYTKITGGQRIDLLGARVEQLPAIWERLVAAGFESGHAYGKAVRTVKSCVGSVWCRYGVQDSVQLAIDLELRYRGLRAPHKIKLAVSGAPASAPRPSPRTSASSPPSGGGTSTSAATAACARPTPSCSPRTSTPRPSCATSTATSCTTSARPTGSSARRPGSGSSPAASTRCAGSSSRTPSASPPTSRPTWSGWSAPTECEWCATLADPRAAAAASPPSSTPRRPTRRSPGSRSAASGSAGQVAS